MWLLSKVRLWVLIKLALLYVAAALASTVIPQPTCLLCYLSCVLIPFQSVCLVTGSVLWDSCHLNCIRLILLLYFSLLSLICGIFKFLLSLSYLDFIPIWNLFLFSPFALFVFWNHFIKKKLTRFTKWLSFAFCKYHFLMKSTYCNIFLN